MPCGAGPHTAPWITPTVLRTVTALHAEPIVFGEATNRPQPGTFKRTLWYARVFINVVSSSNAKMMSAPS